MTDELEVTFADIQAKKQELDAIMREYGGKAVAKLFKDFFAAWPQVQGIGWQQYTPYFNDGDPCEFSVYDPKFRIDPTVVMEHRKQSQYFHLDKYVAVDLEEHGRYNSEWGIDRYEMLDTPLTAACKELAAMICGNEETMLIAFGDHVSILVTPTTIKVSEYDHE